MEERRLNITVKPEFENVDMIRSEIARLCRQAYPGKESVIGDFCLAVTEAMNNAVEHSEAENIEIDFMAGENALSFRISTKGEKFDPTVKVSMPALDDDSELPEGGFGLAIIREMVDSVKYEYADGKNILALWKNI